MKIAVILTAVVAVLMNAPPSAAAPPAGAEFWPQWRGPLATGAAPQGDPPVEFSETKNIRWKVEIPGRGHATPIIWGDRVYVLTAVKAAKGDGDAADKESNDGGADAQEAQPPREGAAPQDPPRPGDPDRPRRRREARPPDPRPTRFTVLALDRKTGKTIWERMVREEKQRTAGHETASEASASPITDGRHIYAYFGSAGLFCLDMDGKVKWDKDFGDMRTRNDFGEGSSPALHGDTVVVTWDHEGEDFIAALDAKSGQERWRKPRDEPTSWATPLIVEVAGKPIVVTGGTNRIRAYDLASGAQVWDCEGLTQNVIPSPVAADGLVIIMSGFRGAAAKAIKLADAKDDISNSPAITWKYDKNTPYVPSPLLYEGLVYFLDNNKAILTCLDAKTGENRYGPQRLEGLKMIYASPVGAGKHVYIADREGNVVVVKHGPAFEALATNKLDDGFDASPAVVGKELFLRGTRHLYCIAAQ